MYHSVATESLKNHGLDFLKIQLICFHNMFTKVYTAIATFKCFLQAENTYIVAITGRAYIGEVLIQVWLKSIKKWVSYNLINIL